jgi:hypothetical protein
VVKSPIPRQPQLRLELNRHLNQMIKPVAFDGLQLFHFLENDKRGQEPFLELVRVKRTRRCPLITGSNPVVRSLVDNARALEKHIQAFSVSDPVPASGFRRVSTDAPEDPRKKYAWILTDR